jgi:serine/threonine-protein kinase
VKTGAGLVMGTLMYMSPEQTRGEKVDPRTDIWSLGVAMYEMVAGFLPFEGANTNETVALILNDKEPPPLARFARDLPTELERIVTKALRKKKDERYQGVKDMLLDLKSLKRRLEFEAELEHSTPPAVRVEATTGNGEAVQTKAESAAPTAPSAKYIASGIRQHRGIFTIALAALVLFIALSLAYWFYYRSASTVTQINSIAVLPFTNESGNPDVEYLSDGMTESIINSLSQLPNMRVIARSTMFSFKGKARDPQTVGEQLSVDAVLMGRVVQRGDSLTLQTDLVKVSDGSQIWGEHYNRKISDILAVQEDISREIVSKLRLRLSGEQEQRVAKRYTENTEAYQLYLLGRFHWLKFTEEGGRKSIDYFNQALAKDPNYALAYHGLSDAYQVLAQSGFRPNELCPKSLVYADKALAADPTLPEAHVSRGAYELWYGWNWTIAEQELKRAMALNPNLADPHDLYGQFLSGMGRFDEAIAENKRSLELDPLSPIASSHLAGVYYWARQYDLAIGQSRKAMELDTNFSLPPMIIGMAYGQQGKYPEAIAELTKARDLPGGFVPATSELGYVYAVSGQRTKAQELLRELQERAKREFVDPYYIAIIHLGLGDQEQALASLNKAYEERSFWMLWLNVEPKFDQLRTDPRFRDLVRRVGLPQV